MSTNSSGDGFDRPSKRPLKIYASDPMAGRTFGNRARIEIDNELLAPGPSGARLEVVDYDGATGVYYEPVDLDHPNILMQGGLDPAESDPRFHQQMVYAVAMRTLENFDRALGRTIHLGRKGRLKLRLYPHAFYGANAFYDRAKNAIFFGYFRADERDPGPGNLPRQTVFTCLSHDIIAHELTHAVVDRLRRYFLEPSNVDVLAFHEGFADIVALFQHFSFQDILRDQIQRNRTDLRERSVLVDLARQFGYASGGGQALRSALDKPDRRLYETLAEPHQRGSILVAAVFDAFFNVYQRRIRDLIRIATGGSGDLPKGDLHPDLVNRVAAEASRTAQQILTMCIRAFDYLPPVDITYGDYLRALVTADFELAPEDEFGQRAAMIEAFRLRGIFPDGVASLAEESLLWEPPHKGLDPLPASAGAMLPELMNTARLFSRDAVRDRAQSDRKLDLWIQDRLPTHDEAEDAPIDVSRNMAPELQRYAQKHAAALHLSKRHTIAVHGFHPVFRVSPNGRLLIELVVQFVQSDRSSRPELGGLTMRGGTTVIASADGRIRYMICKPLPDDSLPAAARAGAQARMERQRSYIAAADVTDPMTPYYTDAQFARRMRLRASLARLHGGMHL